ncbi:MAG TPA: ATP-dependent zinc metalloprotease FtsH [Woeseiaceae bacterium]|nr:ATP-dependent zinc metalloprotease FtsH [Woeseiaceae bacterium]
MDKKQQISVWYVLLAVMVLVSMQNYLGGHTQTLAYSDFKTLLSAGKLEDLTVSDVDVRGTVRTDGLSSLLPPEKLDALQRTGEGSHAFVTIRVEDDKLTEALEAAGVTYAGRRENRWLGSILSTVIWVAVFFGIWTFAMRRMNTQGGMMSVGKSKAKVYVETDTQVTFNDVAGVDEAKEELQEVVNFLKDPQQYGRLGARIPKGILLVGPPGTGKTLFARAVAGEAGVPFFSISGSEFVEMFVGVGAARVRDLFDQARKKAPAIIFIDELDALGRARGIQGMGGGHDEKEQTLNQLLVEMDGFDPSQGLVLVAATNRPEILDPALLRAGRFDRQVLVDRPDKIGRAAILRVHIKKVELVPDLDVDAIAALTPGFTGADLANLVNEAALLATRRGADAVSLDDFTRAIERIVAGLEKKNRLLNPKEREVVAYHEMGHALVAMSLPGVDPVHKISIIPRGIGALGYTIQRPIEDRFLMTLEELDNKMAVLLGGRAAEHLVFEQLSTGASDDLAKATDIARSMVMRYGMDESLGPVVYQESNPLFLDQQGIAPRIREVSNETAEKIDQAVRSQVQSAFDVARAILDAHRDILERGAKLLLAQETLTEPELATLQQALPIAATQRTAPGESS